MNIGVKVREVRKALGLKQHELASQLGVHKITMSNYERGAQTVPLELVERLSKLSERPIVWFFLEDGQSIQEDEQLPPTPPESFESIRYHLEQLEAAFSGQAAVQSQLAERDEKIQQLEKDLAASRAEVLQLKKALEDPRLRIFGNQRDVDPGLAPVADLMAKESVTEQAKPKKLADESRNK